MFKRIVLYGSAVLALLIWTVASSRLLNPFFSLGAALGPACLLLSAISAVTFLNKAPAFFLYIFVSVVVASGFYWVYAFTTLGSFNTHWVNGFIFGGLYCSLASYSIKQFRGSDEPIKLMLYFAGFAILIYVIFSFLLIGGVGAFQTPNSAVLHDNDRGYRIYLAAGLCSLVLSASVRYVTSRYAPLALLGILLSVTALYLSQSRFAQAACALVVLVIFLPLIFRRIVVIIAAISPMAMIAIWWANSEALIDIMSADQSLDIRTQAIVLSKTLFLEHPWGGIGVEAEPLDMISLFKFPFSASDIGPAGVATAFGILGLLLFAFVIWNMTIFCLRSYAARGTILQKSLADAAFFSLLYSIISPTVLTADGGLIAGCILALNFSRTNEAIGDQSGGQVVADGGDLRAAT